MKLEGRYFVYILKCADSSYYIGVTNDIDRRLAEHVEGISSTCYTFSRRPLSLVHSEFYRQVTEAISREKQLKRWSRKKKEALINGDLELLVSSSKNTSAQKL